MPGVKFEREEIRAYTFTGTHRKVANGTAMLLGLCELLHKRHPADFEKLPEQFPIHKKAWFDDRKDPLGQRTVRISNSQVWLDTNMSTKRKMEFAIKLVRHFDYPEESLKFDTVKSHR